MKLEYERVVVGDRVYELATAYGVMQSLQGMIVELLDDNTMDHLKDSVAAAGKTLDDLEEAAIIDFMDGASLRKFIIGNNKSTVKMVATVIRSVTETGQPMQKIGPALSDRETFVMDFLPHEDGAAIAEFISDKLRAVQEARKTAQGESGPSSTPKASGKAKRASSPARS